MRPTGGQNAAPSGGGHAGPEAVLLAAMPLLGLVGLLHRCLCFSPLASGPGYPDKARERAGRTKALWRVCRRIICTGRSECQTSRCPVGICKALDLGPAHILPGGMRFGTLASLAGAAGAVLFFGGPRRQRLPSLGSGGPRGRSDRVGGEAETDPTRGAGGGSWTTESVTLLTNHSSLFQD